MTTKASLPDTDVHDVRRVRGLPARLAAFNAAGVLAAADVHVAVTLGRLTGDTSDDVLLAAALAVRAPRLQHVCVDLATAATTVTADEHTIGWGAGVESGVGVPGIGRAETALGELEWPDADAWLEAVRASGLVDPGGGVDGARPLRLAGSRLYLDRYWRYERRVAEVLAARAAEGVAGIDPAVLRDGLDRLFAPSGALGPDLQRVAAATAVLRRLTVVAGGPGTGKTTTVARVLTLLEEQAAAAGTAPPVVALAAPTGKAAARLEESIAGSAAELATSDEIRARILELPAATIHRLLGSHPGNRTRFRHHRGHPLPHDVVVVDETSMVSLSLLAKLLDAVRPDARLVLLGDPEQLASVEAGAVLGDIVGPVTGPLRMSPPARRALAEATGQDLSAPADGAAATAGAIGDGVVVLRRVHRFRQDSGIAALAGAIQSGDPDTAISVLADGREDVQWIDVDIDAAGPEDSRLTPIREAVTAAGTRLLATAQAGDGRAALEALADLRVLCAHRRGPTGVANWVPAIERWLATDVRGFTTADAWYLGRPVLVTENDYQLGLYNGDVGVVGTFGDERVMVAFEDRDGVRLISPTRLESVETVHAMTVHKSQGSQFASVVVVLPGPDSRVLTRELLYTAVTRAQVGVSVVGTADAVRAAVARPIQRASGLREALWPR